jgi:hypothetical protein
MKLTKDEARILGESLEEYKYQVAKNITLKDLGVFSKLLVLQKKLETFGNDKRRNGRTSQDSWFDLIVRFCKTNKK